MHGPTILHHCTIIKDISFHELFIEYTQLVKFRIIFYQYHKCIHRGGWLELMRATAVAGKKTHEEVRLPKIS